MGSQPQHQRLSRAQPPQQRSSQQLHSLRRQPQQPRPQLRNLQQHLASSTTSSTVTEITDLEMFTSVAGQQLRRGQQQQQLQQLKSSTSANLPTRSPTAFGLTLSDLARTEQQPGVQLLLSRRRRTPRP